MKAIFAANEHYLSSIENEAWKKKFMPVRDCEYMIAFIFTVNIIHQDRKFPPPPRTIPVENKLGHVLSVQEIYSAETVIGVT